MATRRRIGVSLATTEAARRQLMQPVPCWEKVWVTQSNLASGSELKVYKWVKTEKTQQFSDDEDEADEPLAPLPDDPEVVEGDEDLEQDEQRNLDVTQIKDSTDMDMNPDEPPSKLPSPKPQLMMMQSSVDLDNHNHDDALDASLKPLEPEMNDGDSDEKKDDSDNVLDLDMSGLGPDGLQLEGAHDLSQLVGPDGLMGGPLMDEGGDPFAGTLTD